MSRHCVTMIRTAVATGWPMPAVLTAALALLIGGCAPPPAEQPAKEQAQQTKETPAQPAGGDAEADPKEAKAPQTSAALSQALAYYPETTRMNTKQKRRVATRLRARMPSNQCSAKRVQVLMLANGLPSLISKLDAFAAPCLSEATTKHAELRQLARILVDRLKKQNQQAQTNESLRRERNALRQRNRELKSQLSGLKEIERSLQRDATE